MYKCNLCGKSIGPPTVSIVGYDGSNTKPADVHFCSNKCFEQWFRNIHGMTQDRRIKGVSDYFRTLTNNHRCATIISDLPPNEQWESGIASDIANIIESVEGKVEKWL